MLLSLCKLNSNRIVLDLTGLACQKHSIGIFSCTSWPVSDRLLLKLMNKVNTNGKSSSCQAMLPWSLAHKTTRLLVIRTWTPRKSNNFPFPGNTLGYFGLQPKIQWSQWWESLPNRVVVFKMMIFWVILILLYDDRWYNYDAFNDHAMMTNLMMMFNLLAMLMKSSSRSQWTEVECWKWWKLYLLPGSKLSWLVSQTWNLSKIIGDHIFWGKEITQKNVFFVTFANSQQKCVKGFQWD